MALNTKDDTPSPKSKKSLESPKNKVCDKRSIFHKKELAEKVYKAPVIKQRYRRYVSHFHKTKFSNISDNKMILQDLGFTPGTSI